MIFTVLDLLTKKIICYKPLQGVAVALSDPRTHVLLPLLVIIVGSCCCCRVDCFITAE